jgi:predicted nucleic acid-binding protein
MALHGDKLRSDAKIVLMRCLQAKPSDARVYDLIVAAIMLFGQLKLVTSDLIRGSRHFRPARRPRREGIEKADYSEMN